MKELLSELIKQYKDFKFSYADCGKKELVSISQDGEIKYRQKSETEIEKMSKRKKEFDNLANQLTKTYYESYLNRIKPKNLIGAEAIARYVSDEDHYLFDYFNEVVDSAFLKHDVPTIVSFCQTMELPFYYYKPIYKVLEKVCSETLPQIAIICDYDTRKYIPQTTGVFCVLGKPQSHFVDCYNEGYKNIIETMKTPKSSQPQQ